MARQLATPARGAGSDSSGKLDERSGRRITVAFWALVAVGVLLLASSCLLRNVAVGGTAVIDAVVAGLVLGKAQSRASLRGLRETNVTDVPPPPVRHADLVKVLLSEYAEVRATRNLASESGARLFQYYQLAVVAALALTLPDVGIDPLRLAGLQPSAHSLLLSAAAVILSTLAADILHWHHDVLTLEDYQERVLRPRLSAVVGEPVLLAEKHIAGIRRYGGWSVQSLPDLSRRSWIDPFVLKELGHIVVLGLPGTVVAYDAFYEASFVPLLVLLSVLAGIFCVSVWASFWSVSFQYVEWKGHVLDNSWSQPADPVVGVTPDAGRAGKSRIGSRLGRALAVWLARHR